MASLGWISISHSPVMKNSKIFLTAIYLFSPQNDLVIGPYSPSPGTSVACHLLYGPSSLSTRTALASALGYLIMMETPCFSFLVSSLHLIFFGGVPVMTTSYFIDWSPGA